MGNMARGGPPRVRRRRGGPTVSRESRRSNASSYRVTLPDGGSFTLNAVQGRVAWALDRLIAAGPTGCTPITEPSPRWSAYVHDLRGLGVLIETVPERHSGAYSGTHGRYVLRCDVRRVSP